VELAGQDALTAAHVQRPPAGPGEGVEDDVMVVQVVIPSLVVVDHPFILSTLRLSARIASSRWCGPRFLGLAEACH
jgi:hypothetical protein